MESNTATLTHEVFAGWARERPDGVAVVSGGRSLSFGEVDAWADRLAGVLRSAGVGPEVRVGVCLPRSVEWVVAVLGVLKSGGAYVPLDPEYPSARLEFMLSDSGAAVVVGAGEVAEGLGAVCGVPVVAPDAEGGVEGPGPVAGNLAYVIYTSGSTGRPKGVQITHASLSNVLAGSAAPLEVGPGRRTLQCVSFSFDISVVDTLATLTNGGTLVIAAKEDVSSPDRLAARLLDEHIHTVVLPPSILATLVDREFPELAVVVSGGEACPPKLAASFATRHRFVNGYGPTETTVAASLFPVAPELGELASVPIGAAMEGVSLYLAEEGAGAVPPGGTGEICIGGAGVARGYLDRPALTAAAFVPDPFSVTPGSRMYRSGDLGTVLPDGNLEFRGRADHQVKIRGHRIELNEIERALERHPSVAQAAVVVSESGLLGRQVLAFVVPVPGDSPASAVLTGGQLRRSLSDDLPDYMLPNSITLLDEFPLTANRKIDRDALMSRGSSPRRRTTEPVPPRTPVEKDLVEIWQEVLGQPEIGTRDDFFELGGHSLLAAQVVARIEKTYGVNLSLQTLLANGRTVADLAGAVSRAVADGGTQRPRITRIKRQARRAAPGQLS
ncbi:non-ribosomal peptide synthetase [Streptomyces sp. NBC_01217]|uniref:non-ribosomal peptide synthetase n=1 Tax=Streptomyces sp. NBC_01217 TaxID=2903779 RepID=UPI002E1251DC|nr:non-ribosomal peptide synthetase [Streptomyces sp. NBC_01217]